MVQVCKHCKNEFDVPNKFWMANHSRWCKDNPKRKLYEAKLEITRNNISEESRKQANAKIKLAWINGKYDDATHDGFKGKHHTNITKIQISSKRKEFLKNNPEKHPWKLNSKFKSVPCEILKNKLISMGFDFIEEFTPLDSRQFSIDIAFVDKKIGLEINGNQHYNKNGTLRDYYQKRNDLIESAGWKLIQIHYSKVFDDEFINGPLAQWIVATAF